jgi:hypothetical protein
MTHRIAVLGWVRGCSLAVTVAALAACSTDKPAETADIYPSNYRTAILNYLQLNLSSLEGVRDASISAPVLYQKGTPSSYLSCLRLEGERRVEKAVFFLSDQINQYVDATPQQCGAAAYQPYAEFAAMLKQMRGRP